MEGFEIAMSKKHLPKIPDPENRIKGQPFIFGYINGIDWQVPRKYSYRTKSGRTSTVRAAFIFDFASTQRPLYWLFPPAGDGKNCYGIAAMWHDWLYKHRRIGGRKIIRKQADKLFLEIMLYVKVDRHVAIIMYQAVRILGGVKWWRGIKKGNDNRK